MKKISCEMCGSSDLIKQDGVFVCENCGMKYSLEDAKKMMIEGTVEVKGTVKIDNSAFVKKYLENARRAYDKEDWEEVEKYYNMVEQNSPNNMEAVFFSSFGKAMLALTDSEYYKREQKFNVLKNSISVINDYYEVTSEDKEDSLRRIAAAIKKMYSIDYVYAVAANSTEVGSQVWQVQLFNNVRDAFLIELKQILKKHNDTNVKEVEEKIIKIAYDFLQESIEKGRQAYVNTHWKELEKYYSIVLQNAPDNMEAIFFSSFGALILSLNDPDYKNIEQKFNILKKSISTLHDCYEITSEDKKTALTQIVSAIAKIQSYFTKYGGGKKDNLPYSENTWGTILFMELKKAFIVELDLMYKKHDDAYLKELKSSMRKFTYGYCYVATAVYGSYDCPQVWTLRRFRDNTLAATWYGRTFIHVYYAISPTLVKYFGHTEWFRKMWRGTLDRMVNELNNEGVPNTPYNDLIW